jgi:catechol 2,3-dioxygenase-like lactoylglutathione lyase family enzyme
MSKGEDRVPLKLDHFVVAVSDVDRSDAFYRDVLGAEVVRVGAHYRVYRFGDWQLSVHSPGLHADPQSAPNLILARTPVAPGNSDFCFTWDGPIEKAVAHLQRHGVAIEAGPRRTFGVRGPGTSVYFRDPDGSLLEFICYG